jgi:transcriptional regulator with AAA-type ATPase domain
MTNELIVYRGPEIFEQIVLGPQAIEVGSASDCDLTLDHPQVPPRAYLIQERGGTVWLHDLRCADADPQVMALGRRIAVGPYELMRRHAEEGERCQRTTLPVIQASEPVTRWTLLLGRAKDARRLSIGDLPRSVGTSRDCDFVLSDPTVSQLHCRFEPAQGKLFVRDLGSTNGTQVQGVRVARAELSPGMRVRVGRSDFFVSAASPPADPVGRQMVAASPVMQALVAECHGFAKLRWPVLVLGPSGAGKEEVAHLLHRHGERAKGPFVALNAGGLPRELIESELFGHEKGAFTGAASQRKGAFEQAHGGTLFLDEMGELPLDLQARLLRVLETWQIRRVGGERALDVDVRLVCATHRDLGRMVQLGQFREDLYYRLANLIVEVPALRERPEDILALAKHFLARQTPDIGPRHLTAEACTRLLAHSWPGNARELRNVLNVAGAMTAGEWLEAGDIEHALRRLSGPRLVSPLEGDALDKALALHRGNVSAMSRALSVPRSTLRDALRRRAR